MRKTNTLTTPVRRKRFVRLNLTVPSQTKSKLQALATHYNIGMSELLRNELQVLFRREHRRLTQELQELSQLDANAEEPTDA